MSRVIPNFADLNELENAHQDDPKKKTVLKWCAAWCAPCKRIKPTYEQWAQTYGKDGIEFVSIDVDQVPDGSDRYKVSSMPTFQFWYGGRILAQVVGADQKKILSQVARLAAIQD